MQKKSIFKVMIIIFVLVFFILLLSYLQENYLVSLQYPLSKKIIVIDAGHGGIDPGKVGLYGKDEKFINLEISIKLKQLLETSGAKVVMTREDNEGLYIENTDKLSWIKREDMIKRREIINDSNGDLMISIHMNSYTDSTIFGAQTFYLRDDNGSEKIGKLIQEELIEVSYRENNREAKANDTYFILKENNMPSVVVECGFLSNIEEEQMLNDEKYQERISWAIFKGIVRYFYE